MIVRYEAWGAWVKLESLAALVALDRDAARAAGLDGGEVWTRSVSARAPATAPIEVHLAVTARCAAGCDGCYLDARPDGDEPPKATLLARLDALKAAGVFTVAFGGGEPLTRDDLGELADAARARGLTPVMTTSGHGLTDARAARLGAFAQINVSYGGAGGAAGETRAAERAIARLCARGVRVGVNVVLTRAIFDALDATLARARSLGAREAQLLRYKPAGRAASLDYAARRLTPEQVLAFVPALRRLARATEHGATRLAGDDPFHLRIDCALVPFLSADPELGAASLERLGVFGCEAAGRLGAVRVDGRAAPCSVAPDVGAAEAAEWRAHAANPAEPCASCALRGVCKGGCAVVAHFVNGAWGPDPECPRVRAHAGG